MRILTVRQPWAWAIVHGGKDVENRPRNITGGYRGPVAIHAGLTYDKGSHERSRTLREAQDRAAASAGAEVFPGGYLWDFDEPDPRKQWSLPGAIIGVVDLVGVHHWANCLNPVRPEDESTWTGCSSWAEPLNAYHLVLANPRPLVEPIPYTGALGLRDLAVRDPKVVLEITRQIGPH
ncbi:hypothetical protein D8M34_06075 [Microbacterium sp. HSID17254]|uniref:hypothetical protein n=1 Tax=Microbacterium sp. HSID17254 TaxID=2419509 RepID=UPI000F889A08|nr:hypothetical protein [Microbacterium sp. HSID17254]RUQ07035.1 hypothetical protein D8M34_06075 [Microbacterium sp. HSID17254]